MTMSEEIIKVLDELCKRFGLAIDWTNENVIPYITILCEKLVNYEIVTSIVYLLFNLALIIVITNKNKITFTQVFITV